MAIDKEHLEDKLYDISSMAEELLYDVRHMSQDDLEFNEPAPNIDVWKDQIIRSLPKGCSVISVNGKKIKNSYGIEFVTDIAKKELLFLENKLKGMQDTEDKKQAEIKEIEGRIKAVDTANALMDIFGLKMDNESKQKVQSWKDRIEELKGHDKNYRKLMAAVHNVQKY